MNAPLDMLAGVVVREAALSHTSTASSDDASSRARARGARSRSRSRPGAGAGAVRKPRRGKDGGADADSKRALRAERNRQSAAASRDRKKQHLRDLEGRVRYLGDVSAALGAENARLAKLLAASMADNDMLRVRLQHLAAAPKP